MSDERSSSLRTPSKRRYFVHQDGNTYGPVDADWIEDGICGGYLNRDTQINASGNATWSYLDEVERFKALFNDKNSTNQELSKLDYRYAGFWIRTFAIALDLLLLLTAFFLSAYVIQYFIHIYVAQNEEEASNLRRIVSGPAVLVVISSYIIAYIAACSSSWQASLGKRIVGVHVVRANGKPISIFFAIVRLCAYVISWFTLFGFLMAAWSKKKRTLHDRVCGTLVVKGRL